jgi:hypothetical protein
VPSDETFMHGFIDINSTLITVYSMSRKKDANVRNLYSKKIQNPKKDFVGVCFIDTAALFP